MGLEERQPLAKEALLVSSEEPDHTFVFLINITVLCDRL